MTAEARRPRADAQRNVEALVDAARTVFTTTGVDAPIRAIAGEAGVGLATLYRHFPKRSDLVAAVFRHEVDACAAAAAPLAAEHDPGEALSRWLLRYTEFLATKRGLAASLHSGDPAYSELPDYFDAHLGPALEGLLASAQRAGAARTDVEAREILRTIANLCMPTHDGTSNHAERMVAVFIDGLRRT